MEKITREIQVNEMQYRCIDVPVEIWADGTVNIQPPATTLVMDGGEWVPAEPGPLMRDLIQGALVATVKKEAGQILTELLGGVPRNTRKKGLTW